jgi:hypothetical protein
VLDNNEDGFFLMIEGGAPDWAGHFGQTGSLIEEMEDFFNTVQAVNEWVSENSSWAETLVVVVGDHETGFLSGSPDELVPVINNGKGEIPTMYWSLGSRDKTWVNFGWHSNQLVPFFAKGCGSELFYAVADQNDSVRGKYLDNTEISVVIRGLCGITNTYWSDVKSAMDLGLVPYGLQNYSNGISRADFCCLAWQMLSRTDAPPTISTPQSGVPMPFTDVKDASYTIIYTLNQLGIIGGTGATTFEPDRLLTREEAATILNRIAAYLGITIPSPNTHFSDAGSISSWAKEAVDNMAALGVMTGTGGGSFSPKSTYTGQQAIVTMMRLYKLS